MNYCKLFSALFCATTLNIASVAQAANTEQLVCTFPVAHSGIWAAQLSAISVIGHTCVIETYSNWEREHYCPGGEFVVLHSNHGKYVPTTLRSQQAPASEECQLVYTCCYAGGNLPKSK